MDPFSLPPRRGGTVTGLSTVGKSWRTGAAIAIAVAVAVVLAGGVAPTPYVKFVLVHELTHALDDQHFGLDRPTLGDDESAAFDALVEGSAVAVERRWLDSRPPAERDAISAEDADTGPVQGSVGPGSGADTDVFTALFDFPYVVGPQFVQALVD